MYKESHLDRIAPKQMPTELLDSIDGSYGGAVSQRYQSLHKEALLLTITYRHNTGQTDRCKRMHFQGIELPKNSAFHSSLRFHRMQH